MLRFSPCVILEGAKRPKNLQGARSSMTAKAYAFLAMLREQAPALRFAGSRDVEGAVPYAGGASPSPTLFIQKLAHTLAGAFDIKGYDRHALIPYKLICIVIRHALLLYREAFAIAEHVYRKRDKL